MNKSNVCKILTLAVVIIIVASTLAYAVYNRNQRISLTNSKINPENISNKELEENINETNKSENEKEDVYDEKYKNDNKNEHKDIDESKLNNQDRDWYFMSKKDGSTPNPPLEAVPYIKEFSGYYVGSSDKKHIYLTFDEGYENGYTSKILDTLKSNNVKVAFFVTDSYIKSNKDLIKRMVDEGHIVGNHTVNHKSMPQIAIKGFNAYEKELTQVENTFKEITGKEMPKFFRPPMGKYSEKSLYYAEKLGYKSIFWSFAYKDYDEKKQPGEDYAKKHIIDSTHNGAIYLLHAMSKTNSDILDNLIKEWKNKGYEFESLSKLSYDGS